MVKSRTRRSPSEESVTSVANTRLAVILGIAVLSVLVAAWYLARLRHESLPLVFVDMYESSMLVVDPSAARAYAYGVGHFSSVPDAMYDLSLARKYIAQSIVLDPTYPYAYHQLARIDFLRGRLPLAEEEIDTEIDTFGEQHDKSYYIRGLIRGYAGDLAGAEDDYRHFFDLHQLSWAAHADYAWILLKEGKNTAAIEVLSHGLALHPHNPWLLNLNGVALYAEGFVLPALDSLTLAQNEAITVTEEEWHLAYPGNEPGTAEVGIATLEDSIRENIHRIRSEQTKPAVH